MGGLALASAANVSAAPHNTIKHAAEKRTTVTRSVNNIFIPPFYRLLSTGGNRGNGARLKPLCSLCFLLFKTLLLSDSCANVALRAKFHHKFQPPACLATLRPNS